MKRFLSEVKDGVTYPTIWDFAPFNTAGSSEIASLLGSMNIFDNPKPRHLLTELIRLGCSPDGTVLDFFAGSGTTGDAVMHLDAGDGESRRFILVQLPEKTTNADFPTIADMTKQRLRSSGGQLRQRNLGVTADLGFRVFKLASSNIRSWQPDHDDLSATLHESIEHLKTGRTEQDILFELLLKLGLDLAIPIEQKVIAGKPVHSIGAGTLLACLAETIAAGEAEPLALGIVDWHEELDPVGDSTVVFRDSAFADDVAKTNLTAILQQHGLENVRSL